MSLWETKKTNEKAPASPSDGKPPTPESKAKQAGPPDEIPATDWPKLINDSDPAILRLNIRKRFLLNNEDDSNVFQTAFVVEKHYGIFMTTQVRCPGIIEATTLKGKKFKASIIYTDPLHAYSLGKLDMRDAKENDIEKLMISPFSLDIGCEVRILDRAVTERSHLLDMYASSIAHLRAKPVLMDSGMDYIKLGLFFPNLCSPGSPAINHKGKVICMASNSSREGIMIPLHGPYRVYNEYIKHRKAWKQSLVSRGTVQIAFTFELFPDLRTMGLTPETEEEATAYIMNTKKELRFKDYHEGLMRIKSIAPKSRGSSQLLPGDILVKVDGSVVYKYQEIEDSMDQNVGKELEFEFEREGKRFKVMLPVDDLHSLCPNVVLTIAGGVFHPINAQMALEYQIPFGAVYIAKAGALESSGITSGCILNTVAGKEVNSIEEFVSILNTLTPGRKVSVEYYNYQTSHSKVSCAFTDFFAQPWEGRPILYSRDDSIGEYKGEECCSGIPGLETQLGALKIEDPDDIVAIPPKQDENTYWCQRLVKVEAKISLTLRCESMIGLRLTESTGVVIMHDVGRDLGFIVADRYMVPSQMMDICLTFPLCPILVKGEVVFLHPRHSFSIIKYKPKDLGPKSAEIAVAAAICDRPFPIQKDDSCTVLRLTKNLNVSKVKAKVQKKDEVLPQGSFMRYHPTAYVPKNFEVLQLRGDFGHPLRKPSKYPKDNGPDTDDATEDLLRGDLRGGVVIDPAGKSVVALWSSFAMFEKTLDEPEDLKAKGYPFVAGTEFCRGAYLHAVKSGLDAVKKGGEPRVSILMVDLEMEDIEIVSQSGIDKRDLDNLMSSKPSARHLLSYKNTPNFERWNAEKQLEPGDIVFTVDNTFITSYRDMEDHIYEKGKEIEPGEPMKLEMVTFSKRDKRDVQVDVDEVSGWGIRRVVGWCGGLFIEERYPLIEVPNKVVLSHIEDSSPLTCTYSALTRKSCDGMFVTELNKQPVNTLDEFVQMIQKFDTAGTKVVISVAKPDDSYAEAPIIMSQLWPSWELVFDPSSRTWTRKSLGCPKC